MLKRLENVNFSQTQRFGPKYFFLQCIFILLDFLKVDLKKIFVVVFYTFSKVRKIRFFSHFPLFGHKPEILVLYCLLQKRLLSRQNNANLSSWDPKSYKSGLHIFVILNFSLFHSVILSDHLEDWNVHTGCIDNKIWKKRMTDWMNESVNYEAVCRTAPATPGLLKRFHMFFNCSYHLRAVLLLVMFQARLILSSLQPLSTQANPSEPKWTKVNPSEPKWTQGNPREPKWTKMVNSGKFK